jgi:guanine deaminase
MENKHHEWMEEAIALSRRNIRNNKGGPFGAIIVHQNRILSRGTNLVTSSKDPTAHAEIVAIRKACRLKKSFSLEGCDIYTSCEPCPMCLSAIYWARVRRIYYANSRSDAARIGFDDKFIYDEISRPLPKRKIASVQLMRREALSAFQEWMKKENRIRY